MQSTLKKIFYGIFSGKSTEAGQRRPHLKGVLVTKKHYIFFRLANVGKREAVKIDQRDIFQWKVHGQMISHLKSALIAKQTHIICHLQMLVTE